MAHKFSRGKVYTHLLANLTAYQLHHLQQTTMPTNSPPPAAPRSYFQHYPYSTGITAAPSRLTFSFLKQARRYQDDQKVSSMFHDSFCLQKRTAREIE
jgi:hypothetical protein